MPTETNVTITIIGANAEQVLDNGRRLFAHLVPGARAPQQVEDAYVLRASAEKKNAEVLKNDKAATDEKLGGAVTEPAPPAGEKRGPGRPKKRTDQEKGAGGVKAADTPAAPAVAPEKTAPVAPSAPEPAAPKDDPSDDTWTATEVSQAVVRFARHTSMDEAAALLRGFRKADGGVVARASDLDPAQYDGIMRAIADRRKVLDKPDVK